MNPIYSKNQCIDDHHVNDFRSRDDLFFDLLRQIREYAYIEGQIDMNMHWHILLTFNFYECA